MPVTQTTIPQKTASQKTAPTPSHTLSGALAAHRIEKELRVDTPRRLITRKSTDEFYLYSVLILLIVFTVFRLLGTMGICITLAITLMSLIGFRIHQRNNRINQDRLLETGRTVPAVISEVEDMPDSPSKRIVFNYATTGNPFTIDHVIVTTTDMARYGFARWQTFTLLVDPNDEYNILPYFQIRPRVESLPPLPTPTPAVQTAPANTKKPAPVIIAADLGVEAGFYQPSPRRVVWKRGTVRARIWLTNLFAFLILFTYWKWQTDGPYDFWSGWFTLDLIGSIILSTVWAGVEINWTKNRFFLQRGYATQATIETVNPVERQSEYIEITFRYRSAKGELTRGNTTLSLIEAEQVGGISPDTTFTLLVNPRERYSYVPYFRISGVEIPGIAAARTTPPLAP